MNISTIVPVRDAPDPYQFAVVVEDIDNVASVSAHDLVAYKRFQRSLLAQLGALFTLSSIEAAPVPRRSALWARWLAEKLE